ncbi:hypothetical protein [Liquorilactobacillus hordei]|uniref:hypothetical protein n=1 Tax=Liquorilactobacillus hordei TaxID=468911 RepID=UPI0039E78C05
MLNTRMTFNIIAVVFYTITLFLVILDQNMLAMYAMAIGMLVSAIMTLFGLQKSYFFIGQIY